MGYYYQEGFADVKTACFNDATCDWANWSGYDGMLFVAAYYSGATNVASGWKAICFPNPINL